MTVQTAPHPFPRTGWRDKTRDGTASPVEFRLALFLAGQRRLQTVLDTHRPSRRRRLRLVRFAGFPLPALITRCQCCGAVWPCRELFQAVRQRLGWTARLDSAFERLRRGLSLSG